MRKLLEICSLELKALVRSKALATLLAVSVVWMLVLPQLLRGDGTAEGARELYVRFSLGGVFLLLVVALLASATGSLAREREARRLQLTMVRPVRYVAVVIGKTLAHVAVGALTLAVACAVLACRTDLSRCCSHVLSPILPSPREEAKMMYDVYMADPKTPEAVKHAKKEVVLRLLENRAADHYQSIGTNATATWRFPVRTAGEGALGVRLRFTNQYEMRQEACGVFKSGGRRGVVSNITQAVVTVPLVGEQAPAEELAFTNRGKSALMLRPRKDICLLAPADSFAENLIRAYCEMVAVLALVISAGLFLSAGLGRSVALFVAFVLLIVSEMSPSVIEQYPDELETKTADRIGLALARTAAEVTRPVSAAAPLEALSKDECLEWPDVWRLLLVDLLLLPLAMALAAAFVLPRKTDDLT